MTQETLLCILLSLFVIFAPNTYFQGEIDEYEIQNQQVINEIHNDPVRENQIVVEWTPQLQYIDVIDEDAVD